VTDGAATAVDAGPVARTSGLVRSFNKRRAVDGIDLVVPDGAVFGFLGPNGSGKTTTIRLLLGLIHADAGEIELFGQPMPRAAGRVLPQVGALVEGPAFYPYLTATANLARLQALDKTYDPRAARQHRMEALERVGLSAAAGKRFRHYSLGMKQRLGIAAALLRHRDLLILDEPMNGLDPQGTREIRELIRQVHADGTTVIVSSHLLSEVEQVCTHVGIMSRGRLIAQQSLAELRASTAPRLRVDVSQQTADAAWRVLSSLPALRGVPEPLVETQTGAVDYESFLVASTATPVPEMVRALVAADVDVMGVSLERPALEDIFVELTGAGFDVAG